MSRKARQRTSRLPIRMQLMLPIAAALMGMLVLGLFQTVHVWGEYQDATDAEVLADLAEAAADVLDNHQREGTPLLQSLVAETPIGTGVGIRRDKTDAAVERFEDAAQAAVERFPSLENDLTDLIRRFEGYESARVGLDRLASGDLVFGDPEAGEALETYRTIAHHLVSLAERLPSRVEDPDISAHLEALVISLQAGRLASDIQFSVTFSLTALEAADELQVDRATLGQVAETSGAYNRLIVELEQNPSAEIREAYDAAMDTDGADLAREALTIYLRGDIPDMTPAEFFGAQYQIVEALHTTQYEALEVLNRDVDELRDSSTRTLLTTLALILVLALTAVISAAMLARRISLRVDGVREATLTAAYDTLPKTVAAVSQASNADEVDRLLQAAKRQTVVATDARYSDELDSLAEAFSAAHHQALRQTANQALLRIDVEAMMKTLARRGQSLIRRQQQVMEELVDDSPGEIPGEWRSVYHLLSRMRRNEENLLLLAGGEPQRRYNHPVDIEAVIRDAVSEIEGAGRVLVENQVSARLETRPAGDVARILAELLDNAASYSPPTQQVRVTSRRSGSEIVISVADDGIGLNPEQMSAINRRLAEPTQLNSELTATMGLLVVGRLAAEHAISVQLHSTMGKGTLALVRIPASAHAEVTAGLLPGSPGASSAQIALSAHAANLPMTGTGSETVAEGAAEPIIPRPLKAGVTPEPRPVAGPTGEVMNGAAVTAGPGSESVDVTFRKVNRALETAGGPNGTELPRRAPGTRLLPGAVPGAGTGSGVVDLDPAEIRDRLTGFASGIAAASEHEQRKYK